MKIDLGDLLWSIGLPLAMVATFLLAFALPFDWRVSLSISGIIFTIIVIVFIWISIKSLK